MTEDISKLNKRETFPANRQKHSCILFTLHIGPLIKELCDIINAHSPGSVVMYEECWYESFGAGAAGYDQ